MSERQIQSSSSSDREDDAKPAAGTEADVASLPQIEQNESSVPTAATRSSPNQQQQLQPPIVDPSLAMWGMPPYGALESSRQAHSEYGRLPPLASTSISSVASQQQHLQQLERAALLQIELQRQHEMLRLQQSLGLLAPSSIPDHVLQAALVNELNNSTTYNNSALSLLQQPQEQSFLNSLGQAQPDLLAANVAAALQAQQAQLEEQRLLAAAGLSLPSTSQLDSSVGLGLALGATNQPQVTAMSGLAHLPPPPPPFSTVQPVGVGLDRQSSDNRSSSQSTQHSASSAPLKRPKRPLTAYNLFFKARREQLLAAEQQQQQQQVASQSDSSNRQQQARRNSIGFEDLAKIIGKEWKEIDPQTLTEYEAQAQTDKERYNRELELYKASKNAQLEAKRVAMEQSVSDEVRQRYFAEGSGKKRKKR